MGPVQKNQSTSNIHTYFQRSLLAIVAKAYTPRTNRKNEVHDDSDNHPGNKDINRFNSPIRIDWQQTTSAILYTEFKATAFLTEPESGYESSTDPTPGADHETNP